MTRLWKSVILVALIAGATMAGWVSLSGRLLLASAEKAAVANDLAAAEELLQRFTQQCPDQLRGHYLHAQVLRRLRRLDPARTALARAVELGLADADRHREVALQQAARQFTPAIENGLRQALEDRPDDAEVLEVLAEGCAGDQRWDEAERWYTRLVEVQPDWPEAWLGRGRFRLEAARHGRGHRAMAAADLREAVRRQPERFEARLLLANCLLSDAVFDEAREHLLACQQLRGDRPEPLVGLAACALEGLEWEKAEAFLKEALALDPASASVLGKLGDLYLRRERFDQAEAIFRRVVRIDSRNRAAYLKLAQALRNLGRAEEASEQESIYQHLAAGSRPVPD
ncbi:MAG: tetratricopeptide repeat protein [Gemmataceae bacterium]|nr:tetratricopeptide repeat protein [Gemmataceae bacterium]